MRDILEEFEYRRSLLEEMHHQEVASRVSGFLDWLDSEDETRAILDELASRVSVTSLLESRTPNNPPPASTPDEIAAVGVFLMEKIKEGVSPNELCSRHGIRTPRLMNSIQDHADAVVNRFVQPAIDYIFRELSARCARREEVSEVSRLLAPQPAYPLEITESLQRFVRDHPDVRRNGFIMMRFGETKSQKAIVTSIRSTLSRYGIEGLRADEKQYHDDLFPNVLTYVYGCGFGIAVFERLEKDVFNPNVSLEVGYIWALHKPVCLLKDKTLSSLQTDLVGKSYKSFDPQSPEETIPLELDKWLRDKDIITI